MYDDILLPTDGSDAVGAMIVHGLALADRFDARLHALYVIDEVESGATIVGNRESGDVRTGLEEDGRRAVEDVAEAAAERGIDVTTSVREGEPHGEILDYAEGHDVDMIVMCTHGRSGLSRFLIGSVTEAVIRGTERPVLAVHRDDEFDARYEP